MDAFKQPRGAIFQWLLSSTWLLGLMLGGAGVLAFLQVQAWSERNEFARLDDLATRQLDLHVAALESELHRHADLPSLMSVNPDVDALLAQAGHPSKALQERASRALANAAGRTGSREIFVVDRSDTVLATSDWFAPSSLLGSPLPGISCAAVTSGRARGFLFNPKTAAPEYYFVHAVGVSVAAPGVPEACLVVKISLAPMESTWVDFSFRPDSEKIMVLDEHDVVILSSVPHWRYRTTQVFQPGRKGDRAGKSPAYPATISPLEVTDTAPLGRGALLVNLPGAGKEPPSSFVAHSRLLASTGWWVVLLSNPAEIHDNVRTVQLAAAAVLAFIALLALYLHHRRKAMRQLMAARNALQRAHDDLEVTVANRTQELREANRDLLHEMHERQQAEAELLQAKKMAMLGQMSAKISHEISQPLTALRALATNSRAFLAQEKWTRVDANLNDIADIAARMSNITRQLKIFSGRTRKTAVPYCVIDLGQAMRGARHLLLERFENEDVTLSLPTGECPVSGDAGQLEQVFVNLFSNALDALRQVPEKHVEVRIEDRPDSPRVIVRVKDSGPGIPAEMQAHLFEPFYTSKPTGEGLGLGLVICASIVREHGGQLRAQSSESGAEFVFDLERASSQSC